MRLLVMLYETKELKDHLTLNLSEILVKIKILSNMESLIFIYCKRKKSWVFFLLCSLRIKSTFTKISSFLLLISLYFVAPIKDDPSLNEQKIVAKEVPTISQRSRCKTWIDNSAFACLIIDDQNKFYFVFHVHRFFFEYA